MSAHRHLAFQLSRRRGFKLPPGVISVARPGLLGNPFSVAEFGIDQAIALHRSWLIDMTDAQLGEWPGPLGGQLIRLKPLVLDRLAGLRGVGFACWCGLPEPYERDRCHRAALLDIANA